MKDYTIIELDAGVLHFHVEGAVEESGWRRLVGVGISWLRAQGGGKLLLPHPPVVAS